MKNFNNKTLKIYAVVTLFCIFFNFVYSKFSHEVSSNYMTYMFLYPLIGGVLIKIILIITNAKESIQASNFYDCGLATLLVWSCLKGIFEIAGASSSYESIFFIAGLILIIIGIILFVKTQIKANTNS